jgi:hypothetical protein
MGGFLMKYRNQIRTLFFFTLLSITLLTVLFFNLSAISAVSKIDLIEVPKDQILYTQHSLYYEKNQYLATNYLKGTLVPVNTEVKFIKVTKNSIEVILPDGQELIMENIRAYSGEAIDGFFKQHLADKPVDLSQFTAEEKKAIMEGQVKLGMSKSAVIKAIGYPPKHKTLSLQNNQWLYWQNRFGKMMVVFEKDKVIRVKN